MHEKPAKVRGPCIEVLVDGVPTMVMTERDAPTGPPEVELAASEAVVEDGAE